MKIPGSLLLIFLLLFPLRALCQQYSIKGKVADSLHSGQPLKGATVILQSLPDSISRAVFVTEENGDFEFKRLTGGNYRVEILYMGYTPYSVDIMSDKNKRETDLGLISLAPEAIDLGNVTVSGGSRRAITVKKDTIEFRVANYKTKPNAVLADLLRKLPGIQVDKNGEIKAHGETIQRIMIDGVYYFADDPKIAALTLPPDIVDRVQVVDDKTQKEKFTGFSDGKRRKAINIVTKKKIRGLYFGKAVGGAGTDGRYTAGVDLTRLDGPEQLSIVGNADNTNRYAYSGSAAATEMQTVSAGVNYKTALSKKTDLSGSFNYQGDHGLVESESLAENVIREDSAIYNNRKEIHHTDNNSFAFNLKMESNIDSLTMLTFSANGSVFNNKRLSTIASDATTGKQHTLMYGSVNADSTRSSGYDLSRVELSFQRRFRKPHRSLFANLLFSSGKADDHTLRNAINRFIQPVAASDTINQEVFGKTDRVNFNPSISYIEPIGKSSAVEMNYVYHLSKENSGSNSYDFNTAGNSYTGFDSLFSTSFRNITSSQLASAVYRLQGEKYSFSAGAGMHITDLRSTDNEKAATLNAHFTAFAPSINFNYNPANSFNLSVNYEGYNNVPGADQLQPVLVTRDSINFFIGNATLQQSFAHRFYAQLFSYNQGNGSSLSFSLNASKVDNDIRPAITNQANAGKTITYVNLPGTYSVSGYLSFGVPLRKPKSNLDLSTSLSYDTRRSLIDGQRNDTHNTALSGSVGWNSAFEKDLDVSLRATGVYNFVQNSLQTEENENYFSQVLGGEVSYYPESGWLFSTQVDYTHLVRKNTTGYNADIAIVNLFLGKQLFKDKRAELKLSVYDLFRDNESITRTISGNVVRDERINVPGRYMMLSFTYNLRQKTKITD